MARLPRLCAAVLAFVSVAACSPRPSPSPAAKAEPVPDPAPAVPVVSPPVGRAEVLAAVAAAAEAYAAGGAYPDSAKLGGRRFSIRLPFGCAGRTDASISHDPKAGTLKVAIRPLDWTHDPRISGVAAESDTEAIEGFWLRWPWLASDQCPRGAPPAPGAAVSPEGVALVQLFPAGSSRLERRSERGYETTVKAEAPPAGPLRLQLRGRVADPENHRPVRCAAENGDQRPLCVILIEPDHVTLEQADGAILAEWGR